VLQYSAICNFFILGIAKDKAKTATFLKVSPASTYLEYSFGSLFAVAKKTLLISSTMYKMKSSDRNYRIAEIEVLSRYPSSKLVFTRDERYFTTGDFITVTRKSRVTTVIKYSK
jgi:hypothetical protein